MFLIHGYELYKAMIISYSLKSKLRLSKFFYLLEKSLTCKGKTLIFIKFNLRAPLKTSDCIGRGIYGDTLMQEFLDSMMTQKRLPLKMLFINKGVKLTCANPQNTAIETLKKLQEKGVEILVNLSSLEELDLQKKHQIGTKISMFELAEIMISHNTSTI